MDVMEKKITDFLSCDEVMGLAESTQDMYRYVLMTAFLPFMDSRQPFKVTDVVWFTKHLEDKGMAGTTIQQYLTVVKIFLKWSGTPVDYTYRIPNKERKANALKRMNRWFDENDIEKCLNYKYERPRDLLIVRLLIETGIRIQELSDISAKDVDINERTIRIKTSKTKPRVVFFSPVTSEKFVEAFLSRRAGKLFPGKEQVYTIVRSMLEDLGLKDGRDGRGPHTFRHYCATYLFYVGDMRLEDIARLLGDTPDVIERQYIHPTPKMLRERTDKAMGWV